MNLAISKAEEIQPKAIKVKAKTKAAPASKGEAEAKPEGNKS